MKKNDRVVFVATGDRGSITKKVSKAKGAWAEQFYEVKLDDNDLCEVTVGEHALVSESEYDATDES